MAITTYTAGEVLTAASLNNNFASGGLQLVKTQTIGSAVSSVTVTGAFSATYDNYKIIVSGGANSANAVLSLQLGSTTANYLRFIFLGQFTSNTVSGSAATGQPNFGAVGQASTNSLTMDMELQCPFLAKRTAFYARNLGTYSTGEIYVNQGFLDDATSYTAFTLATSTGTMTGGTIKVYGYANS